MVGNDIDLSPISETGPTGEQVTMRFGPIVPIPDKYRAGREGLTVWSVAKLFIDNGEERFEVREQSVYPEQFARGWRGTAMRRMRRMDPDELTPQVIISHRR